MINFVDQETGEVKDIIYMSDGQPKVYDNVIDKMVDIETRYKSLKNQYETYRQALQAAMEEFGVTKITSDRLNATYVEEGESIKLNSKKVKEEYPRIFDECSEVKPVKAHVRVTLK